MTGSEPGAALLDPAGGAIATVRWSPALQRWRQARPGEWYDAVRAAVLEHGAVLFRGFPVGGPAEFEAFAGGVTPAGSWMPYHEKATPRSEVAGHVTTSTEYHPSGTIYLHNECCHHASWPLHLFFSCRVAAASGGRTPVADIRAVTRELDELVRPLFAGRTIRYVRNFGPELGASVAYAFGTDDRAEVERYCGARGIAWEWLGEHRLRTHYERPAYARHPLTGEELWFNNLVFYHPSTIERRLRLALRGVADEDLPFNSRLADGSPVPPEIVDACRRAYDRFTYRFDWSAGDVLMLDNMRFAHGREPYTGERRVWVVMTEETRHG